MINLGAAYGAWWVSGENEGIAAYLVAAKNNGTLLEIVKKCTAFDGREYQDTICDIPDMKCRYLMLRLRLSLIRGPFIGFRGGCKVHDALVQIRYCQVGYG